MKITILRCCSDINYLRTKNAIFQENQVHIKSLTLITITSDVQRNTSYSSYCDVMWIMNFNM